MDADGQGHEQALQNDSQSQEAVSGENSTQGGRRRSGRGAGTLVSYKEDLIFAQQQQRKAQEDELEAKARAERAAKQVWARKV